MKQRDYLVYIEAKGKKLLAAVLATVAFHCLLTTAALAQLGPTGGRDTSFTVQRSCVQEKKHHPGITLADSTLPAGVRVSRNISYSSPTAQWKLGTYSEVPTFEDAPHTFVFFNPWFEPTVRYITAFLQKVWKE